MTSRLDSPQIVSFILNDDGGAGHVHDYHQAVTRAVAPRGWLHFVHVPRRPAQVRLPENWQADLSPLSPRTEHMPMPARIMQLNALSRSIRQVLCEPSGQPRIAFLESFSASHLIAFVNAFRGMGRHNWHAWLLFRGIQSLRSSWRRQLYALLLHRLAGYTAGRLVTLTDSAALSAELSGIFRRDFHTLPIPHAPAMERSANSETSATRSNAITCWWAGAPRPEKGINEMRHLVGLTDVSAKNLTIIASKSADLCRSLAVGGANLVETDDALARKDYEQLLASVDVVLLPYDPVAYRNRTSGVFIEAINAHRIPITTQGSWMGAELEQNDLGELALSESEWMHESIATRIITLAKDNRFSTRLDALAAKYGSAHSEHAFADAIQSVWDRTIQR